MWQEKNAAAERKQNMRYSKSDNLKAIATDDKSITYVSELVK